MSKMTEAMDRIAIYEGLNVYQVCPSVTNLMLAYMETIGNSDSNGRKDLSQIGAIVEKSQISEPELLA